VCAVLSWLVHEWRRCNAVHSLHVDCEGLLARSRCVHVCKFVYRSKQRSEPGWNAVQAGLRRGCTDSSNGVHRR
jgi:hypothetical protein